MAFELPKLNYSFDALEPHIDARTMELHHDKHHAGYTSNLNAALEKHEDVKDNTIEALLGHLDELPEDIRETVRNNGGGFANHSLYWSIMSPDGGGEPEGDLLADIKSSFGGFDTFKEKFTISAATHFGSGWAWLALEKDGLHVCTTPNQDTPLMKGNTPILGIDIWEHAYYLNYQNKRAEYIMAWWNVVDWGQAARNLVKAKA